MLEQPLQKTVTCSLYRSLAVLFVSISLQQFSHGHFSGNPINMWIVWPLRCFCGIGWHKLGSIESKVFPIGIQVQEIVRFRAMNSARTCNITTGADERRFWWLLSLKSRTFLRHDMFLSPGFSTVDIGDPLIEFLPHSSDKRANGLLETISLSSPSCSSSPSLLGRSSLWALDGGASRWVDNSSASFSWCRNLLLSECLSCRIAISFVSECCCHSAVKKRKRMMNMLKMKRIKLKHHWLMTVDINCLTWISETTFVYYRSCKQK